MTLLKVDSLCSFYDKEQVIFDFSFSIDEHEICSILGANGAGKTTILNSIVNIEVKKTGSVSFQGQDISKLKTHQIIRKGISYVPEMRGTFNALTVAENLSLGSFLQADKVEIKKELEVVYDYFPFLKNRLNQAAGTLSGGEQQMLAISRCLLMRPKLLVFDEPSLGLAPIIVKDIFKVMKKISEERGIGILVVEQNVHMALNISQRVILIDTGKSVMAGTPDEFRKDKAIQKTYLGLS
jgi:branched-chain amino acid transport system ATP-binding protein